MEAWVAQTRSRGADKRAAYQANAHGGARRSVGRSLSTGLYAYLRLLAAQAEFWLPLITGMTNLAKQA